MQQMHMHKTVTGRIETKDSDRAHWSQKVTLSSKALAKALGV